MSVHYALLAFLNDGYCSCINIFLLMSHFRFDFCTRNARYYTSHYTKPYRLLNPKETEQLQSVLYYKSAVNIIETQLCFEKALSMNPMYWFVKNKLHYIYSTTSIAVKHRVCYGLLYCRQSWTICRQSGPYSNTPIYWKLYLPCVILGGLHTARAHGHNWLDR